MPRINSSGWKSGDLRIWSGEIDDIPNGWELATEMIDRAVVGAGGAYAKGQKFGADSRTPAKPSVSVSKPSVSVSISNHTLSTARMPSHTHSVPLFDGYSSGVKQIRSGGTAGQTGTDNTNSNGSSGAHNHGATVSVGNITATVGNVGAVDTRQSSIAVIWIRKL